MKKITLFIFLFVLSSCATPNTPVYYGNFSEAQLGENEFEVSFLIKSSSVTRRELDYNLLHSAEVAMEKGFRYFSIVDTEADIKVKAYHEPMWYRDEVRYSCKDYQGYTYCTPYPYTIVYPGREFSSSFPKVIYRILCYREKPKDIKYYKAESIAGSIRQKYSID